MSEPKGSERTLADTVAVLSNLPPFSGDDYNALISLLGQEHSIRDVVEIMHQLTGRDVRLTYHDVLAVMGGHRSINAHDVDRMRGAAHQVGWRTSRAAGDATNDT